MKKFIALLFSVILCFSVIAIAGCSANDGKDGADGKDGVNGTDGTDGKDGVNGTDGTDGEDGKSAYELYVENNPSYTGDESQFIKDLADGKLESEHRYNIISYGRELAGEAMVGTVNYTGGAVALRSGVVKFDKPAVMPLTENAEWEIHIGGILSETDKSAQLLTSSYKSELGRIYLGVCAEKNIIYLGVNIGGYYLNYCWNVPGATIKSSHEYTVRYGEGVYTLSIDGGDGVPFDTVNANQSNSVSVTSPQTASNDLTEKIKAVTGEEYFSFISIGADKFESTCSLGYLDFTTSSIYNYKNLSRHPLYGKTVYHLGSSISYGSANGGVSFAEQIAELTGSKLVKETVSGTTLSSVKENSYVARYAKLKFDDNPAYLVLQLSTNDFSQGIEAGTVSAEISSWDEIETRTLSGAIEYIIACTREFSPSTKVLIYTCSVKQSWGHRSKYSSYINTQLKQIQAKWGIEVADLFNKQTLNTGWMDDDIHPTGAQYANLFTPVFINKMVECLNK